MPERLPRHVGALEVPTKTGGGGGAVTRPRIGGTGTAVLTGSSWHACYNFGLMWDVVYLPEAESERLVLPKAERNALIHAVQKLETFGPDLGYPHSSAVQGFAGLRELRPRTGRSPWRALYRRVGDVFVIAAVGPEAQSNQRGFKRATRQASARLAEITED